ncbi:hypothetical protein Barb6XT_01910 [Bacteroidales bacterium Barb6XT]|nr:hypothetical protein Barb6XT_01910 [Bacteroidales bacterium Barb6XT]
MKQIVWLFACALFPLCVSAQLAETFAGSGVTSAYPWEGDTEKFTINEKGELQLNAPSAKGEALLYLSAVPLLDNEWRFTVRNDYQGTTSNYFRIYLWSLQPDTKNPEEAVFIRLGYSKKNIALCRQSGNKKAEVLLDGRTLFENPQEAEVKVTTDKSGLCTVYSKCPSDQDFYKEGEAVLKLPSDNREGCFMIAVNFSAQHNTDKYADNIHINRFTLESETPVEPEKPVKPSEPEIPEEPEPIPEPVKPETPDPIGKGDILINEVMADPNGAGGLPETEYVELYNASQQTLSLQGCSFGYGTAAPIMLKDYSFASGTYLILYREGKDIEAGAGIAMPLAKFPVLANTGKELSLYDATGAVVDQVIYKKASAGVSWERQGESWQLSSDYRGGTPGASNSLLSEEPSEPEIPEVPATPAAVQPNDIIFNEILPNPYPDASEYIELYNRSGKELPLSGLSVATRKTDGSLSTRYPLSSISAPLSADEYAVLTKDAKGVTDFYHIPCPENIHTLKLPVLANTNATLVLFRTTDGAVIDELSYSSKWHTSLIKEEKGVSLERIDPEAATQDASNWTSASSPSGYGTPGSQNSQYGKTSGEQQPTQISKPQYSHETGLYAILYLLDQAGYSCRASVYDLSGRHVADISDNELIGTSGKIFWNGTSSNGSKLTPGLYILYIELYHGSGKTRRHKEVFLVH